MMAFLELSRDGQAWALAILIYGIIIIAVYFAIVLGSLRK